jgi:hydroxylaminobenzene mutase
VKQATYWLVLYGDLRQWGVTTLAAIFGTGALSPIAAPGLAAQPWQEELVTAASSAWGSRSSPPPC